jgi:hypothetical protein
LNDSSARSPSPQSSPRERGALARAYFESAQSFAELTSPAYSDLVIAVDSGILEVSGWTDEGPSFGESEQKHIDRAAEVVFEFDRNLVPMFDPGATINRAIYGCDEETNSDRRADVATRLLRRPAVIRGRRCH